MDISLQKRISSRHRAALAGLSVLGCCMFANVMFADVSSAAVPTAGVNCVASDGKISGRGSTYQIVLQKAFNEGYTGDYCGSVNEQYAGDPAGHNMVAYNYPKAEENSATGSGAGLKAASCRSDAFEGTDTPYSEQQLVELNSAPTTESGKAACELAFQVPYTPQGTSEGGKFVFPSAGDTTAPLMSFPIGGSAVALVVNFGTACTKDPTALKLTAKETSRLFGGDVATWADAELVANNPILTTDGCTGAVTRVVRQDSSGTTNIFKQYLIRAELAREGQKCGVIEGKIQNWEAYFSTNTEWPGKTAKHTPAEEGTCSAITTAAKSGNPELLKTLEKTNGGIGYADLPQAEEYPQFVEATVENSTGTALQAPSSSSGANCTYTGVVSLPGSTAAEAVGLAPQTTNGKGENITPNWANNAPGVPENVTDRGSKYPICGLTFDLVYTNMETANSSNPVVGMTADQRRTLYSYFTYILGSNGQNILSNIYYAPLPSTWLQTLREGFQENF